MPSVCVCVFSSCGLAEELEQESKGQQKTNLPKSACGSVSTDVYSPPKTDFYKTSVVN